MYTYCFVFLIQVVNDSTNIICDEEVRQGSAECREFYTRLDISFLLIHMRFTPTKPLFGKGFKTVFDKLEYEVMALVHPFGCVAETKADIVVSGQNVRDASWNGTWNETWTLLSSHTIEFVLYELTIRQDTDIMFDNVIALFAGRIIRVVERHVCIHDFSVEIGDRLRHENVNRFHHSAWDYVGPYRGERYVVYGFSHPYNADYRKTVVSAESFPLYNMCAVIPQSLTNVVNFMHLMNCSLINVSISKLQWTLLDNGSLRLQNGFMFNPEIFYYTSPQSIAICDTSFQEYVLSLSKPMAKTNALTSEGILSVVCVGCSIFCLLISLCVYTMLPKLRKSLPGLNTLVLICCLLVSQTVFLFDILKVFPVNSWRCKILGLVIHFALLCSLFWMNVCTFHMYRVLARVRIMNSAISSMRFMLYICYALLMSLIFVATNIIVSYVRNDTLGYGRDDCYIDTREMVHFTVALPVGFVVILNSVFFILVTVNLTKTSKIKKNVKNNRNSFKILVKLSSITGITWIFGLVYSFTGEIVFAYTFIVLNASQGVFLFFAFIATKSVAAMMRERLCGQKKSPLTLCQQKEVRLDTELVHRRRPHHQGSQVL